MATVRLRRRGIASAAASCPQFAAHAAHAHQVAYFCDLGVVGTFHFDLKSNDAHRGWCAANP